MFYSLLALIAFNIAAIAALAGAFSTIAGYRSEISAVKESLNYRCQQLYLSNVLFLNKSEMSFLKLSQDTASRINVMDEAILNNLQLLNNLSILLNKSRSQTLLQNQVIHEMISKRFLNFSARLKERNDDIKKGLDNVDNNCEVLVNYSASTLANDLKNLHVFKTCDTIEALTLPFPSGRYKIGSLTNNTMTSCSTNSVSSCKGVLGQWRRIAYLNTSEANWQCPEDLIKETTPPSCIISGNNPACLSVFFSNSGFPYSKVCGRIHARYFKSPDGFSFFTNERPDTPSIDDNYVDGVSLTHGCQRNHIWTFSATVSQKTREGCVANCDWRVPSFVGTNYSCVLVETCTTSPSPCPLLWNGKGDQCVGNETFYRTLTQPTNDDIEMRVCRDQDSADEDILLTFVEIFVAP